jgi:two-component system response regulator DesR
MRRMFIASRQAVARSALRVLLSELNTEVVGEAGDWPSILAAAPQSAPDVVVVDWNVMLAAHEPPMASLRQACPSALVVILMSRFDDRQKGALGAGAEILVCKDDAADCVVETLRSVAATKPARIAHEQATQP